MWIRHLSFSVKGKFLSAKLHLTGHLNHQWSENNTPSFNPESKLLYVDWCNRFGLVWTSLEKEIHGPKTTFKNGEFDCLKTTDPLHSAINPPIDGLRCWLSINGHHSVDAFTVVFLSKSPLRWSRNEDFICDNRMFSARRTRLIYIFSSDCLPFTILPSIISWSTVDDHFLYFKSAFIPSKIIGSYLYIHVQSIVQIVIDIISTYTFSKMSFNSFVPLQWEEFV